MTKKKINQMKVIIFCMALFLFCTQLYKYVNAEESNEIKNVLIINSYHEGLVWTKEETKGIVDTLLESGSNVVPLIEYMDWKNYESKENSNYLFEYYKYKYQNKDIDVIITTDDAALEFALENRKQIFSNAPIVFCGVNQTGVDNITYGHDNVTGVIEESDPTDTIKVALDINPSIKNIYLLYDNTKSGISTGELVRDKIKQYNSNLNIIPCNNMVYEDIVQKVKVLKNDSIILITNYYSDVNNKKIEMDFVTREVSANSSVPVYHLYDFGLNNGAIGGTMLSGILQGRYAADLAMRILMGESANDISVSTPESTRTVFDYQQLDRFAIPLKSIPKDSALINKPVSFYEAYKTLVIVIAFTFALLVAFVCLLLFYIRKIKRMKRSIAESHEELTQLYVELTASDEEMRQQYDEILIFNEKIRVGEEQLSFLAYHDSLTGLPNKLSLYENSKQIFISDKSKAALLFIDIDNFKYVNDTMGHAFGDHLISKVSERLTSLLDNEYALYRLSGDEFIIILEDIHEMNEVEKFAGYIISGFLEEFNIINIILHISLSIGIVMYPEHGSNLEELLKYADIAMYQAKDAGRKRYMIYDQSMNEVLTERVNIEKYLHNALDNNEFEVYYQPQLDLKTKKITGIEALLRWKSPELGNVSPLRFIKVAEDTHIIIPLGTWVLKSACAFLKRLNEKGFENLTVSVNISILQLLQTDFCDIVNETLEELQMKPEYLELEITESILMESFENIKFRLSSLCSSKIKIALDDFGKGYSSLNYLKQLPITTLKVDKSFVDNIVDKSGDTLTGHIVNIGKSMGMSVVAEGVETQDQLEYLAQHDCDKIQGYLYSRPIPEEKLILLLEKNRNEEVA